jgi:hypothetical protein
VRFLQQFLSLWFQKKNPSEVVHAPKQHVTSGSQVGDALFSTFTIVQDLKKSGR